MDKANSILGYCSSSQETCYASLSEPHDSYVQLDSTFSLTSQCQMSDLPGQDESTRATGPPSMDIPVIRSTPRITRSPSSLI